jgi:hypothetical protein
MKQFHTKVISCTETDLGPPGLSPGGNWTAVNGITDLPKKTIGFA